jgi:hypothetical protein
MATNVATALHIDREVPNDPPSDSFCNLHSSFSTATIRPVTWEEWICPPIRDQDEAVQTVRGPIRIPTVIVAVNYAKAPKKRPKLCARSIRERAQGQPPAARSRSQAAQDSSRTQGNAGFGPHPERPRHSRMETVHFREGVVLSQSEGELRKTRSPA